VRGVVPRSSPSFYMGRDVYLLALKVMYTFYALLLAVLVVAAGRLRGLWALPAVLFVAYALYLRDKRALKRRWARA